jgi:hypothetical protein
VAASNWRDRNDIGKIGEGRIVPADRAIEDLNA